MCTLSRDVHPLKASMPMRVTPSGMKTSLRDLHPAKARFPITVTPFGITARMIPLYARLRIRSPDSFTATAKSSSSMVCIRFLPVSSAFSVSALFCFFSCSFSIGSLSPLKPVLARKPAAFAWRRHSASARSFEFRSGGPAGDDSRMEGPGRSSLPGRSVRSAHIQLSFWEWIPPSMSTWTHTPQGASTSLSMMIHRTGTPSAADSSGNEQYPSVITMAATGRSFP